MPTPGLNQTAEEEVRIVLAHLEAQSALLQELRAELARLRAGQG